jgi:hypothetical protein
MHAVPGVPGFVDLVAIAVSNELRFANSAAHIYMRFNCGPCADGVPLT